MTLNINNSHSPIVRHAPSSAYYSIYHHLSTRWLEWFAKSFKNVLFKVIHDYGTSATSYLYLGYPL